MIFVPVEMAKLKIIKNSKNSLIPSLSTTNKHEFDISSIKEDIRHGTLGMWSDSYLVIQWMVIFRKLKLGIKLGPPSLQCNKKC